MKLKKEYTLKDAKREIRELKKIVKILLKFSKLNAVDALNAKIGAGVAFEENYNIKKGLYQ